MIFEAFQIETMTSGAMRMADETPHVNQACDFPWATSAVFRPAEPCSARQSYGVSTTSGGIARPN
jgi:hypothetical protein